MPNIGGPELLIILAIVILLFGATKLPGLAKSLGESIRVFRKELKPGESKTEKTPETEQGEKPSDK